MQKIKIDNVGYDPRYYPRESGEEDWMTVAKYLGVLRQNPEKANATNSKVKPFPPIIVVRASKKPYQYLLIDGLHRTKSFKRYGLEDIYATIERIPESKWLARATELNAAGSRPLTSLDIASVIVRLESRKFSMKAISDLVEQPIEFLEKIKIDRITKLSPAEAKDLKKPVWNDNGSHAVLLKKPFKDFSGTSRAKDLEKYQSRFNDLNCSAILNSCADLLESDALDLTDIKTIEGLERVKEAAAEYEIS